MTISGELEDRLAFLLEEISQWDCVAEEVGRAGCNHCTAEDVLEAIQGEYGCSEYGGDR